MDDMINSFERAPLDHLAPHTAALLDSPLAARLSWVDQDIFIAWDGAEMVLRQFETRFNMPSGPRRRCLLLLAPPGTGKTWIHREFLRRHKIDPDTLMGEGGLRPILLVSLAAVTSEEDFLVRILTTLGAPIPRRTHKRELKEKVVQLLRASGTRVLIFDECQDLGHLRPTDVPNVAAFLRHMTNEGGRPLILMGSAEAHLLIISDEHLRSRFDVVSLNPWKDVERARSFIYSLLTMIPLPDPSPVTDDETIGELLEKVGGNTERIVLSVKGAGRSALMSGAQCIDRKRLLENAVEEFKSTGAP